MTEPAYSRVLLKLSGEALAGPQPYGIDLPTVKGLAGEIKEISDLGVAIALVLDYLARRRDLAGLPADLWRLTAADFIARAAYQMGKTPLLPLYAAALGAGEILLTSWDRDGTGDGYDLELLRRVTSAVGVPVIASGGADSAEHMAEALLAGADAVLAASILHDGHTTVGAIKKRLAALGAEVRL